MARYVICYDIGDDRRRHRLHKLLRSYGDAPEESVFELALTPRRLDRLRGQMRAIVDRQVDIVRIYELCQRCEGRIEVVVGPPVARPPMAHIV